MKGKQNICQNNLIITDLRLKLPKTNILSPLKKTNKYLHSSISITERKSKHQDSSMTQNLPKNRVNLRNYQMTIENQQIIQRHTPAKRFLTLSPKNMNNWDNLTDRNAGKTKGFICFTNNKRNLNQSQLQCTTKQNKRQRKTVKNNQNQLTPTPNQIKKQQTQIPKISTIQQILEWRQQDDLNKRGIQQYNFQEINKKSVKKKAYKRLTDSPSNRKKIKSDQFYIKLKLKKTHHQNFNIKNQLKTNRNHPRVQLQISHREIELQTRKQNNFRKNYDKMITEQSKIINKIDLTTLSQYKNDFIGIYSKNRVKNKHKTQPNQQLPYLQNLNQTQAQIISKQMRQKEHKKISSLSKSKKLQTQGSKSLRIGDQFFSQKNFRPWSPQASDQL